MTTQKLGNAGDNLLSDKTFSGVVTLQKSGG